MADLYLATIAENEFWEFVRQLPGLVTPYEAYLEQLDRKATRWTATAGNAVVYVPVSLSALNAYIAAGRARNLTALSALAHEKGSRLPVLRGSDCTIVRVTMNRDWERPTATFWITATTNPEEALAAVKRHAQPDWIIEVDEPAEGSVERFRLSPGEACRYPPPKTS